jgi:hypothetical protein
MSSVSRLYAHSKNYDMDLTLDINTELFPLKVDQSFAMALASSLARGGTSTDVPMDGMPDEGEDKDRDVWRPDGKGRRGLEEDYEYVMYGKVSGDAFRNDSVVENATPSGLQIRFREVRDRVRVQHL